MNVIALSALDLSFAAGLVVLLALLSLMMQLGLFKRIIIAAIRTTVQLTLIGLVLKTLFYFMHLVQILR